MVDDLRAKAYIDEDATDAFLDQPPIRYTDGSTPTAGIEERLADPEYVAKLPKLPSVTDDA